MGSFTDWATSYDIWATSKFQRDAFALRQIEKWKLFVSYNPSAPDYTGTSPRDKLLDWKQELPEEMRAGLSREIRAFNVRQQAFTWFHELSDYPTKAVGVRT